MTTPASFPLYVVTRNFRGQTLYLLSYSEQGNDFLWSSNVSLAPHLTYAAAHHRAQLATAHYKVPCHTKRNAIVTASPPQRAVAQPRLTDYQQIALKRKQGKAPMAGHSPTTRKVKS